MRKYGYFLMSRRFFSEIVAAALFSSSALFGAGILVELDGRNNLE